MITNNAQQFKSFLMSQDINLDFMEDENGNTLVEIRESLKCGTKLRVIVIFNKEDSMVSMYGIDFVQGINPTKRNYMYEAINDLNNKYTYYKFLLDKDRVEVQSFVLFDDNFSNEVIMKYIMGMINVVEQEFSGLMKIMWS